VHGKEIVSVDNTMSEWIEIFVTYDNFEAEIVKDLLESAGISVHLRSSKVTPYPVNVGKMGEVKLFVKQEDNQTAQEIIRSSKESENNIP
jgi:hypothetical protein